MHKTYPSDATRQTVIDDLDRRLDKQPDDPSCRRKRTLNAARREAVNLVLNGLNVFDRLRG